MTKTVLPPLSVNDQQKFYQYCVTGRHEFIPLKSSVKVSRTVAAKKKIARGTKTLKKYGF